MSTYCFDIDGTICNTPGLDYTLSSPIKERIDAINKLYDDGHVIIMFTARGSATGRDWSQFTRDQLQAWGVSHSQLIMGKPAADVYIDDRAQSDRDFFANLTL